MRKNLITKKDNFAGKMHGFAEGEILPRISVIARWGNQHVSLCD